MKISFTTDSYVLLLTTVPPDSEAFAALTKATKVDSPGAVDEFSVECSEVDAQLFLAVTQESFPKRVTGS
jgi:hypothetical protein